MSRSGYTDDCDDWALIRWRGAVASATRGARGQAMLKDLLAALDAMPVKELIANELVEEGHFCALGALGAARGIDMSSMDPEDRESVARTFDVAMPLAAEIMYMNDDDYWHEYETPADRWQRMRKWVASQIKAEGA